MATSLIRRRDFVVLASGVSCLPAMLPLASRAQQPNQMRRVGVLMGSAKDDVVVRARLAAFLEVLQQLGWTENRDLRIEIRWAAGSVDRVRQYAAELTAFAPDVLLAPGGAVLASLLQATRAVPIVFVHVPDPVGAGFVRSLARPGGNATGFINHEYSIGAKWLELLIQVAPSVKRAVVIRDPAISAGIGLWGAIQSAAASLGVDVSPVDVRNASELEYAVTTFARSSNGGLIATGSSWANVRRDLIIALAARHRLPAVYFERYFVAAGGLISYGADFVDLYRRAAVYVDRILKGEKPTDLPVQLPNKFDLAVNLKTAKALGLAVPESVLLQATEVIE